MNIYLVLGILFFHWVFDFVCQSDKEAKGKSKELYWLLSHTITYSLGWITPILIYVMIGGFSDSPKAWDFHQSFDFITITFLLHTLTDYFTSKINARLWEQGKTHKFFVSIGFDQFLHFAQLLITFKLLTN